MTLPEKIKTIYPELKNEMFLDNIRLRNDMDGRGDYIEKWEHPTLSKPTAEQLEAL